MIIAETLQEKNPTFPGLSYIKEEKMEYTKHDLLFKRLLETFFAEFMEAFFPELYEEIDFESLTYLSEEMVPRLRDGNERRLDIVVEVKWKLDRYNY